MYVKGGSRGKGGKVARLLSVVRRLAHREQDYTTLSASNSLRSTGDGSSLSMSMSMGSLGSQWEVSDSDEEDDNGMDYALPDVPAGCLAVYVGEQQQRFVIRAQYLNHSLFKALLDKSRDEFGFQQKGALHIPCEVVLFEHLLWVLSKEDPAAEEEAMGLHQLLNFYAGSEGEMSS